MTTEFISSFRSPKLPVVMQSEAAECGLACLAMIARYYGHNVNLQMLRQRFNVSLTGMPLRAIANVADALDLQTRFIRAELEDLKQIRLPAIAYWDLNHYVVIAAISKHGVTVHDPAVGRRTMRMEEVSRHFTGLLMDLAPTAHFQPIESQRQRVSLKSLFGKVYGWKGALSQILLLAAAIELMTLIIPLQAQWIIDDAVANADKYLLITVACGFVLVTCIQGALTAARGWALSDLGASLGFQWVFNLFAHLLRLPMSYFEKRHIGDVTSRFTSVEQIQRTLSGNFIESLLDGATSCFAIAMLAGYNAWLGLVAICGITIYGSSRFAFYGHLRRLNEEMLVFRARQQSELLESIRGIQAIKLANSVLARRDRFGNCTMEAFRRDVAVQRLVFGFSSFNQIIFGIQRVVILLIAGYQTINGHLTAGMMVAAAAFSDQFTQRAGLFIDRCIEFRVLRLHLDRIADIALTEPEQVRTNEFGGTPSDGSLEVRNVSFRYSDSEPWILKDVSLRIPNGSTVAIVGRSGSGKTTLIKIMLGLLEPAEGEICFGGASISKLGAERFRDVVSAVMQDDQLFAGSIAENISFFAPDPDMEQIEQAARQASIHDEITSFPMGYLTLVGDMGSTLSGGQKQRILLARALYRKPRALILDEATSHLDAASEHAVNHEVSQLSITRVIIAHRKETIDTADFVFDLAEKRWWSEKCPSDHPKAKTA